MKVLIDNLKVSTKNVVEIASPSEENFFGSLEQKAISSAGSATVPFDSALEVPDTRAVVYDLAGSNGALSSVSYIINKTGLYYIKMFVTTNRPGGVGTNADSTLSPIFYVNGVEFLRGNRRTRSVATSSSGFDPTTIFSNNTSGEVEAILSLEEGDYIRFLVAISTGGTLLGPDQDVAGDLSPYSYIQVRPIGE